MKAKNVLMMLTVALFTQNTALPMGGEQDPEMEDFVMVEVTNEPAKKAKLDVDEAKRLISNAQKKLKAVESVAKSEELDTAIKTSRGILAALRRLAFKNGPGFEIHNKTNDHIWVCVVSNGKIISNNKKMGFDSVAAQESLVLDLKNLKEDIKVAVYQKKPTKVQFSSEDDEFTPAPHYVYETTEGAQGKTKYFTWNPEKHHTTSKYLYPQTGRLAGMAKGSSSGYLLTNNIKSHQLILSSINEEETETAEETE